ncbi:MAG: hypothetical protein JSS06_06905 [Proteobacteria bacterium]|nr:hypothetical protein [Pseudomonadota bacterium]
MTIKIINGILVAVLMVAASTASATLESRLSGMAYYDTDTGLTWAAPVYTIPGKPFFEQVSFLSTFTLGGTSDWEIPALSEFSAFIFSHSDHSIPWMLIPYPPLDTDMSAWNAWYWVDKATASGSPYGYRPSTNEFYPGDVYLSLSDFDVWPVHVGDVPVVAVPEPQTYAMLLVGIGLIRLFSSKKDKLLA